MLGNRFGPTVLRAELSHIGKLASEPLSGAMYGEQIFGDRLEKASGSGKLLLSGAPGFMHF